MIINSHRFFAWRGLGFVADDPGKQKRIVLKLNWRNDAACRGKEGEVGGN